MNRCQFQCTPTWWRVNHGPPAAGMLSSKADVAFGPGQTVEAQLCWLSRLQASTIPCRYYMEETMNKFSLPAQGQPPRSLQEQDGTGVWRRSIRSLPLWSRESCAPELTIQNYSCAEDYRTLALEIPSCIKIIHLQWAKERKWPTHQITVAQISSITHSQPGTLSHVEATNNYLLFSELFTSVTQQINSANK